MVLPNFQSVDTSGQVPNSGASFQSKPLTASLHIVGVPRLELNLSVDRPGRSHIVAELWEVHPNGNWERLDFGGRGLAQRLGRDHDDPVPALTVMQVSVDMNPISCVLAKGDKLALTLAGDDPNLFQPNGNTPTFFLQNGGKLTLPVQPNLPPGPDSAHAAQANPLWSGRT